MQITQRTDFGLRVMLYLAVKGGEPATIAEIATAYGISRNHLMKIVQELAAQGYLAAMRGKHGGIRLGRAPADIRIGELVRALEPDFALAECFRPANECVIAPACLLKHALRKALAAFMETLDQCTLADMVNNAEPVSQLLEIRDRV